MKRKKNTDSIRKNVSIFHHELNMEHINGTTYWIITELVFNIPVQMYFLKIPDSYKDNSLLGQLNEKYAPFCPN